MDMDILSYALSCIVCEAWIKMISIDNDHDDNDHDDNDLDDDLYLNENICCSHGELASCWYVLLSGAVFIQVHFAKLIKMIITL